MEIESSRWDTIRIYYHLSDDEIVTYDQGILLFIDSSNNEIHQILITVNGELINDKNIELIVDSDELDAFSYNPILKIKVRKEGLYSFISSSKEGYEENVLFEIGTKSGPNLRPIIIFLVIGILTFTIIKTKQIIKSKNTNIQDITKVLHNSKINPDDDAFKEFDKNVFDDYE